MGKRIFIELTSRKPGVPGPTLINIDHITEVHREDYAIEDIASGGITIMGAGNIPVRESYDEVMAMIQRGFDSVGDQIIRGKK